MSNVILCMDFFQKTIENFNYSDEELINFNQVIQRQLDKCDVVYINESFLTKDEFQTMCCN